MLVVRDKIKIEPNDFDYLRSIPINVLRQFEDLGDDVSFDDYAKMLATDCTERINRRLLLSWSGTRSKETRDLCVRVFGYLWKMGIPPGQIESHNYIRLGKIKDDLGYSRNPNRGRPNANERKKKPHREMTLMRVLNRLERSGLIEGERPNKRTTSFRVSPNVLSEILSREEQNRRFNQNYFRMMFQLDDAKRRFLAIEWHLTNKMGITKEEIDHWVTEWPRVCGGHDQTSQSEIIGVMPPLQR